MDIDFGPMIREGRAQRLRPKILQVDINSAKPPPFPLALLDSPCFGQKLSGILAGGRQVPTSTMAAVECSQLRLEITSMCKERRHRAPMCSICLNIASDVSLVI